MTEIPTTTGCSSPGSATPAARAAARRCGRRAAPRCGLGGAALASPCSPRTPSRARARACKGSGAVTECDPVKLVTDPERPLLDGAMDGTKTGRFYGDRDGQHVAMLRAAGPAMGVDFSVPWARARRAARASSPCAARATGGSMSSGTTGAGRASASTGSRRSGSAWSGTSGRSTSASTPTIAARPSSRSCTRCRAPPAAAPASSPKRSRFAWPAGTSPSCRR